MGCLDRRHLSTNHLVLTARRCHVETMRRRINSLARRSGAETARPRKGAWPPRGFTPSTLQIAMRDTGSLHSLKPSLPPMARAWRL